MSNRLDHLAVVQPLVAKEIEGETLTRLANQIVAACHDDEQPANHGQHVGLVSLPSERELSSRLGMSRHAVRNALALLQRQGVVCRPNGRGPLLIAPTMQNAPSNGITDLRCINVIFNSGLETTGLHWLRDEYLAGYTEVLEHQSCKTRHVLWQPDPGNFESLLWCHASPQKQACLVVGRRDPELLNFLIDKSVPFVIQNYCLYDYQALPPHHKVYVNKAGASFATTQHLLDLGHRRIGFVGPTPNPQRSSPEYEGYHAALSCAGLRPEPNDVIDLNTEVIERALGFCQTLLDSPDRPTAVLGGTGANTIALYQAAIELGISVPQDLSIVGFDDVRTPTYSQLSTIAVPRRALGRQAMELLLEAFKQPDLAPQTRVLDCGFNFKETIGPVSD
jgi:DNA-binding LacI/PurR family transcriptional regulator